MPTCFVVMGFGTKTDFVQGKTFDLDKTYKGIIKPAVEAAGYTCIRADEIQHAGNINVPMYEQLYQADLVIADLSTANLNAFFELGVRYGLKPRTTIVIGEKGLKIPFDMGQVIIRHYEHLGPGIDFEEVDRMRTELTKACKEVTAAERTDSPVYTFLHQLAPPAVREVVAAARQVETATTPAGAGAATTALAEAAMKASMGALMDAAMNARATGDFKTARAILSGICAAQGHNADPFVIQQLALATYKSKDLEPHAALTEARAIMEPLDPKTTSDPETLGLWGAIHKRLFEVSPSADERRAALDEAVAGYEKGFYLRNDFYTGINYAFVLNMRAAESSGDDAIADRVQARRVRLKVLDLCTTTMNGRPGGDSPRSRIEQEYWLRATRVEALYGLGRAAEADAEFATAKAIAPEQWMIDSTQQQIGKLLALLAVVH